uniref:EGF-like domain-containing protein n=1 Tax=Strongyloides venezuelensis TaxID=75913 RepID=A0A0K0EVS0_STRVS
MLVKFLPILLFIFQDAIYISSSNVAENGKVYLRESNCDTAGDGGDISNPITINFNELVKYEKDIKEYQNVNFNEIRILHLDWDRINNHPANIDNRYCGLKVVPGVGSDNYYITYSAAYNEGNNFDDISKYAVKCTVQQCDIGLVFFDKNKKTKDLNKVYMKHTVEHAVLMVIKSSDNKMILGNRPYHNVNIRLGICPYLEWVPKKGEIKFIPEEGIFNNGYNEKINGYAHIVVPFYKKNYDSDLFICGKLKQPTLPDLLIGFKLRDESRNIEVSGEFNPLKDDIRCHYSNDPQYFYHFGYSETNTNFMSERIMDVIGIRQKDSKYNFYAGQKIYIYNWKNIADGLKNVDSHLRLDKPRYTEEPRCIRNLKSDIKATILPTIGSVDLIQRHQKKNLLYRLIKSDDLDKQFSFKCLSKVEGANNGHMEEFYSRSAELSIKNEEKPNIIYTLSKNQIIFNRKNMDNYGSYRCKESKATTYFNKNIITMDKVYYLPNENSELSLGNTKFNKKNEQYIGCIKQYESLGVIKKMRIEFGENVMNPINIDDFSNATDKIDIKENLIIYKTPTDVPGVIIQCTYETPAETTFFTKKEIHFFNWEEVENKNDTITTLMSEKTVNKFVCNSTPWIIGIVCIVILFCIIIIIMVLLIIRKIRKRKANNMSLSSFESSVLYGSKNKGSSVISGSLSTTTNKSRSAFKSTASKSRNDSRSSASSKNISRNSTSRNQDKKKFISSENLSLHGKIENNGNSSITDRPLISDNSTLSHLLVTGLSLSGR